MGQSGTPSSPSSVGSDPRIDAYEDCCTHSSDALFQILHDLLPRHYPGRLAHTLVVTGKGRSRTRLGAHFPSHFAQARVTVLNSGEDLKTYVDAEELVVFAGGKAKVTSDAFECSAS